MNEGERQAWLALAELNPEDVCRRTGADYVLATARYTLPFYGHELLVDPAAQTLESSSEVAAALLQRLAYFANLSVVNYLVHAVTPAPTGRLIKPMDILAMQTYFTGSHQLPLGGVSARYAHDADGFGARGRELGGTPEAYGDASVLLRPLPGAPAAMILWLADDEFPPRADLLVDEICERQMPIDVIWSLAMLTVLAMQM